MRGPASRVPDKDSGLHRTYIGSIERGEKNVTIVTGEKIAAALGLRLWQLLKRADE